MKKRFIVLVDFSAYSENLLTYACDWGQRIGAELLLVHQTVVLTPAFTDRESRAGIARQINAEALEKLRKLRETLLPPEITVSYSVSEKPLQVTLPVLLSEPFEQLIFVGLKGAGLLKKFFIGSTAVQVIELADNIVAAIPKGVSKFSPGKLFVAVSEKHAFNVPAFNHFLGFTGDGIENITFFNLARPGEDCSGIEKQLGDLANRFSGNYNAVYAIYEGNNAFEDIKQLINDKTEEMLVVQKGSRLLADQLFRKFLINELVYEGQTPLVVLP